MGKSTPTPTRLSMKTTHKCRASLILHHWEAQANLASTLAGENCTPLITIPCPNTSCEIPQTQEACVYWQKEQCFQTNSSLVLLKNKKENLLYSLGQRTQNENCSWYIILPFCSTCFLATSEYYLWKFTRAFCQRPDKKELFYRMTEQNGTMTNIPVLGRKRR